VSRWLQPSAHAGSSLADFSTLKMEATRSSETSVQSTRSTPRHIPEDGILHSHRRENLKSYILVLCWYSEQGNFSTIKVLTMNSSCYEIGINLICSYTDLEGH
jgi:hypothetical protein